MQLDFGVERQYNRVSYVADVTTPILGVDFLGESKFIIKILNGSITDKCTNTTIIAASTKLSSNKNITTIIPRSAHLALLDEFPSLLSTKPIQPPKHNIVHRIRTIGGPVHCKPRRLHPHISASVKPAFAKLLSDGIISVSCSPWCCPLHCVAKKDDSWRPTGHYRPLNNLTIPDMYPLPHLQSL